MGRTLTFVVIIIMLLASTSLSVSTSLDGFVDSLNTNEKKWTFMFYGDGDWTGGWPLTNFLTQQEIASSDTVDIVVLEDVPDGPAKLWYIDNSSSRILLEEKGEINMGDYETLRDFINYSKQNYPAERYVINLWDHGSAWRGACMDITNTSSPYDIITMDEMQNALKESGGVDIIGFSACEMGCVESAYELRNYTDVYIGSEEMHGMFMEWAKVADILKNYPDESTYDISYKIIDLFRENNPYYGTLLYNIMSIINCLNSNILPYPPALTIAAVRTDRIGNLVNSIDNYSKFLIDNIQVLKRTIRIARLIVDDYPRPMRLPSLMGTQIDIIHFVDLIEKPWFRILMPKLHELSDDIRNELDNVLIDEYHQVGHRKANGLSIYFPPTNPQSDYKKYEPSYSNCGLDFSADTNWDEFLELYLLN